MIGQDQNNVLAAILAGIIVRAWWAYDKRQAAARALLPPDPVGPGGWADPRARQDTPARRRGVSRAVRWGAAWGRWRVSRGRP